MKEGYKTKQREEILSYFRQHPGQHPLRQEAAQPRGNAPAAQQPQQKGGSPLRQGQVFQRPAQGAEGEEKH